MKKKMASCAAIFAAAAIAGGCGSGSGSPSPSGTTKAAPEVEEEYANADFTVNFDDVKKASINAGVSVHDPSVIKIGDTYYIYGSHLTAAKSSDLRNWTTVADGYSATNPVYGGFMKDGHVFDFAGNMFSAIPTDDGGTHIWAPDVIYNEKQDLYYMYFCTSSTFNASNLCYATSKDPEGKFKWQGPLIYSGYSSETIDKTDVLDYVSRDYADENYLGGKGSYDYENYPNAIDPSVFRDGEGKLWMVYGSWSGGIYLLELDEKTGKVLHPKADPKNGVDPYYGKRLIGGGHTAIEGPYILYDSENGFYYLFVSYGSLTRTGGYQIRVFRSKSVDGDYVDMEGEAPGIGKGNPAYFGLKLSGNYMLPSLEKAYMATGHNSALIDDDGRMYIVNHTRFDDGTEYHEPRVHQFLLNEDGWPCMLPYATDGEEAREEGYDMEEMAGEYYVINQGTAINADIAEPFKLILTKKGNVYGDGVSGTWKAGDGSFFVTISYDGEEYKGVFCKMKDEAKTPVMAFSAVGKNQSIWGVKYFD